MKRLLSILVLALALSYPAFAVMPPSGDNVPTALASLNDLPDFLPRLKNIAMTLPANRVQLQILKIIKQETARSLRKEFPRDFARNFPNGHPGEDGELRIFDTSELSAEMAYDDLTLRDKGALSQTNFEIEYDFGQYINQKFDGMIHPVDTNHLVVLRGRIITRPGVDPIHGEILQVYLEGASAKIIRLYTLGAISSAGGDKSE